MNVGRLNPDQGSSSVGGQRHGAAQFIPEPLSAQECLQLR